MSNVTCANCGADLGYPFLSTAGTAHVCAPSGYRDNHARPESVPQQGIVDGDPVLSTEACVFAPPHEPWICLTHDGTRTSLDETQCDIVRPAEPFNDAYLDNIKQAMANPNHLLVRLIPGVTTRIEVAQGDRPRVARTA